MVKYIVIDNMTRMVRSISDYYVEGSFTVDEEDYSYVDGFGKYLVDGRLVDIADSDEVGRQALIDGVSEEVLKDKALNALTVTIGSGKVFYADPASRVDISDAIAIAISNGVNETTWKLAEAIDGSKLAIVTLDEMKEARELALHTKGVLVGI